MDKSLSDLQKKFKELQKKYFDNKNDEVIKECNNVLKQYKIDVFYNLLCLAYNNKGNFLKAIDIMNEALKQNPNNVDFLNNMGMSYKNIYKYKKAEEFYNKILFRQPNAIAAIYNLANLYNTMGEFEKSKKLFFDILKLRSDLTEADRIISQMTKYDNESPHFISMKNKLSDMKLTDRSLMHLHFALGKAYDDQKKYEKSFINYKKANDISKKISKYNFEIDRKKFLKIKNKYSSIENIQINKNSRNFLFIIGMPRSGTSLTEQIISSHEDVFGGGELPYIGRIYENYFEFNDVIKVKDLSKCERDYIEFTSHLDNTDKVFTDKAPLNFFYIGYILKFLPNSKFINIIRNPVDNCWSLYKNHFPTKINFANDLNDLVDYYRCYEDLMKYWRKLFPNHIYDLHYENLINNTKVEVEKLLKFCSLKWDDKCLDHQKNKRVIKTISYNQARKPIYKTSVKSFKGYENYLSVLEKLN